MNTARRIAFGLGGNVGDSRDYCERAVLLLAALPVLKAESLVVSSFYRSPALLPDDAPSEWDQPFINQVVTLEENAKVQPEQLLAEIKQIEQLLGRQVRGHWAPREIDIDIVAIEGAEYTSETLTIPHPRAHERAFVVLPLAEIWPDCRLVGGDADGLAKAMNITKQDCQIM